MNEENQIDKEGIENSHAENEISDFSAYDINKTETTLENETKINDKDKEKTNINNNKFDKKSSLKGCKYKINKIKKEILNIFNEDKIMERLDYFQNNNNTINIENIYKFQELYENQLEKLFNNKMEKIDEINEKFNSDLNELNYYMEKEKEEEEDSEKNNEENSSAVKIMYDGLISDKNKELNEIEQKFKENYDNIKNEYLDNINSNKYEKYYTELFKNIKQDILNIIKPKNTKKVSFDK